MQGVRRCCKPDIERLCAGIEPGGERIAHCLKEHKTARSRLKVGCGTVLSAARRQFVA